MPLDPERYESVEGDHELTQFFVSAFSSAELRSFLLAGPESRALESDLPSGSFTHGSFAAEAVAVLRRRGLIDIKLFQRLFTERPSRARDLTRVRDVLLNPNLLAESPATRYRRGILELCRDVPWWADPIRLSLRKEATGEQGDARELLSRWIPDPAAQHCILVGDAGSGKSGLMLWLTSALHQFDANALVLLVPAKNLLRASVTEFGDLADLATPHTPGLRLELAQSGPDHYLLLDGLDELTGSLMGGDQRAADVLTKVLRVIPGRTRVITTCRTPVFHLVEQTLKHRLPAAEPADASLFAADLLISEIIGRPQAVSAYTLLPVQGRAAISYLTARGIKESSFPSKAVSGPQAALLSRPLTIRLLQAVLPRFEGSTAIPTDILYEKWVRISLKLASPGLKDPDISEIERQLTTMAMHAVKIKDHALRDLLVRAEILAPGQWGLEFSHHSLWEYFIARSLFADLIVFDSTTFSAVDLVSGYNVNRILVPMLLRRFDPLPRHGSLRPVSASEYGAFLSTTGWRRETGYGVHPSMMTSQDGTPSSTLELHVADSEALHAHAHLGDSLVSGISWYDAALFALHSGRRLPLSSTPRPRSSAPSSYWCCDWNEEPRAHLRIVQFNSGAVNGANPDLRTPKIGLAILEP